MTVLLPESFRGGCSFGASDEAGLSRLFQDIAWVRLWGRRAFEARTAIRMLCQVFTLRRAPRLLNGTRSQPATLFLRDSDQAQVPKLSFKVSRGFPRED